jgi:hypothetical protein
MANDRWRRRAAFLQEFVAAARKGFEEGYRESAAARGKTLSPSDLAAAYAAYNTRALKGICFNDRD